MRRFVDFGLAGACLAMMLFLSGCGAQPGKTKMTYHRTSGAVPPPNQVESGEEGEYAVYPSDGTNPIASKKLNKGDEYGFEKDDNGNVVAFVVKSGQHQQIPLGAKLATSYYWKYKS